MIYDTRYNHPSQPHTRIPDPPHPDFHNYDGDYTKMIGGHNHLFPEMFFYLRTRQPPNIISYSDIDGSKAVKALCDLYGVGMLHGISQKSVNFTKQKWTDDSIIVQINNDMVIYFNDNFDVFQLMYTDKVIWEELHTVESVVKEYQKEESHQQLHLLVYEQEMGGFRLKKFKLTESEADIALNYNSDFTDINNLIIHQLTSEKSKGIVLLHGAPGTGKTSYIRYLVNKINKKLIYIPSSIGNRLGDPEFLPFLVRHTGCVLIIEDAEDILQERTNGDNGTIANLLNLSDGLLSDCLNIQIICTFNAPLTRIDKALLRKGRVIASYEFKALAVDKSNQLLKTLGSDIVTTKELTLAEVFYQKDLDFMKEEGKVIGFGK